eukprot:100470-Prymnesium_polylepis.1
MAVDRALSSGPSLVRTSSTTVLREGHRYDVDLQQASSAEACVASTEPIVTTACGGSIARWLPPVLYKSPSRTLAAPSRTWLAGRRSCLTSPTRAPT